ncbi:MAG: hypothetical protein ACI83B_000700 [Sediminicola sp.]|jgi:hypothetical protein
MTTILVKLVNILISLNKTDLVKDIETNRQDH